jgi:xylose isomerase
MIKKLDNLIGKLGMSYIQSVIDENSAVKVSDLVIKFLA